MRKRVSSIEPRKVPKATDLTVMKLINIRMKILSICGLLSLLWFALQIIQPKYNESLTTYLPAGLLAIRPTLAFFVFGLVIVTGTAGIATYVIQSTLEEEDLSKRKVVTNKSKEKFLQ